MSRKTIGWFFHLEMLKETRLLIPFWCSRTCFDEICRLPQADRSQKQSCLQDGLDRLLTSHRKLFVEHRRWDGWRLFGSARWYSCPGKYFRCFLQADPSYAVLFRYSPATEVQLRQAQCDKGASSSIGPASVEATSRPWKWLSSFAWWENLVGEGVENTSWQSMLPLTHFFWQVLIAPKFDPVEGVQLLLYWSLMIWRGNCLLQVIDFAWCVDGKPLPATNAKMLNTLFPRACRWSIPKICRSGTEIELTIGQPLAVHSLSIWATSKTLKMIKVHKDSCFEIMELNYSLLLPAIIPSRSENTILLDFPWIPQALVLIQGWCLSLAASTRSFWLFVTQALEQPELAQMVGARRCVAIKWCLGAFKKMTPPANVFASEILSHTSCIYLQRQHNALDTGSTAETKR